MSLVGDGEVQLYGYRFRLVPDDKIQETLESVFPGKIVIGDQRRVDDPILASYVMQDWTGGMLKYWMDPAVDFDRFYWSNCTTWYTRQLTLAPYVRTSTTPSWGDTVVRQVRSSATLGSGLYVAFDEQICAVDANEVITVKGTIGASGNWANQMIVYRCMSGTNAGSAFIVIAHFNIVTGASSYHTFDGTTLTAGVGGETCVSMCIWDDKLVKVDDTGALRYTTDLATWYPIPGQNVVPLPAGSVTKLLTYPDIWGNDLIHILTNQGVYFYDDVAQLVRKTRISLPAIAGTGAQSAIQKDQMYINTPALSLLRYGGSTISNEGLDQGDGLPGDYRGQVTSLCSSLNYLAAAVSALNNQTSSGDFLWAGNDIAEATTFGGLSGFSSIYIQTTPGGGWHGLYSSPQLGTGTFHVGVTSAANNGLSPYRLLFGQSAQLSFIDLWPDIANPLQNTIQQFQPTGQLITPWNEMGWSELEKLAVRSEFGVKGVNSDCTGGTPCQILVEWGLNYNDAQWNPLCTITSNTPPIYTWGTSGLGQQFKSIRFRYTLTRCTTLTHTPVLVFHTMSFLKELPARWGYRFTIDCTRAWGGLEAAEQAEILRRLTDPTDIGGDLGQFSAWVDGEFVTRNVKVSELAGLLSGGTIQKGIYHIALVAP